MTPHPSHPGLRSGMELLRALRLAVASFWLIMLVLFLIIGIFVAASGPDPTSVWTGARWAPQYFLGGAGFTLAAQHLRIHVSHGVTRRHYIVGGIWSGIAVSVIFGVVMELGFVLERVIYHANDWIQFDGTKDLAASPGAVAVATVEFTVMYAAYFFAGWLIGSGYYRFRAWTATLLMIPAVLPPLVIESMQWRGGPVYFLIDRLGIGALTTPAYLAAGSVLVAATVWTIYLMLGRVSVGMGTTATR